MITAFNSVRPVHATSVCCYKFYLRNYYQLVKLGSVVNNHDQLNTSLMSSKSNSTKN